MKNWQSYFEPHILARGYNYMLEGRVHNPEFRGQVCTAQVQGSEEYDVEIVLTGNRVEEMHCTCPYARAGSNCKHMAAVLYTVSEEQYDCGETSDGTPLSAEKLVQSMSDCEVRSILTELLQTHEPLRREVYMRNGNISPERLEGMILSELETINDTYSDYNETVDEENAYFYAADLAKLLENRWMKLYDCCGMKAVLRLMRKTAEMFRNHMEDDVDDGYSMLEETTQAICSEMFGQCSMQQKEAAFSMLVQWIDSPQENPVTELIKSWLNHCFREPEFAERRLELVKKDLQQAGDWIPEKRLEELLTQKYLLLRQIPDRAGELQEFRTAFMVRDFIRRAEIRALTEERRWEEAIALLHESREMNCDNTGLVREYTRQLIELYEQMNRPDALKVELLYDIRNCVQGNLSFLLRLKELSSEEEWDRYRTEYLNREWDPQKLRLMEHEKLWDQLMDAAEAEHSLDVLRDFAPVLQSRFPDRFPVCFAQQLREKAEQRGTRGKYQGLMQDLNRLRGYPGGEALACALAQEWRRRYPSRSAMLEELRKAGF